MVILIIFFEIALCIGVAALVSAIITNKEINELHGILYNDEEPPVNEKYLIEMRKQSHRSDIVVSIITIVLSSILLTINIYEYCRQGMEDVKLGKYEYEQTVKITTRGDTVKTDTTYVFHRIKEK